MWSTNYNTKPVQVHAHSQPMAGRGHSPGLLKLAYEKCVYVPIYVRFSVRTHMNQNFK